MHHVPCIPHIHILQGASLWFRVIPVQIGLHRSDWAASHLEALDRAAGPSVGASLQLRFLNAQEQQPPSEEQLAREVAAFRAQVLKFSPFTLQASNHIAVCMPHWAEYRVQRVDYRGATHGPHMPRVGVLPVV
jgi:hypothetical protein